MSAKKAKSATQEGPKVRHWGKAAVEYIKPLEMPIVYANNAQMQMNNWDVALIFGEIVETTDKLRVAPKARVTISLQFALELRDLLVRNIELFEGKFGPIQKVGENLLQGETESVS